VTGFRAQWNIRTRELTWVVAYAVVVGVLSILIDILFAVDGELVAISRIGVALVGIAGGVILWRTPGGNTGWLILVVWAALQIPMVAWSGIGSPTEQFFAFPLGYTRETTENGVVTDYEQYAVNIVGIALLAVLLKWRDPIRRGWRGPVTTRRRARR
jgi:hypothetical protein